MAADSRPGWPGGSPGTSRVLSFHWVGNPGTQPNPKTPILTSGPASGSEVTISSGGSARRCAVEVAHDEGPLHGRGVAHQLSRGRARS